MIQANEMPQPSGDIKMDDLINRVTEEAEWEVFIPDSNKYEYAILNTWNTSAKNFVNEKDFIEWANKELGIECQKK